MIDLNNRPLSFSSLKEFALSPKHYMEYISKKKESTPDMILGSAFHCFILENEKFDDRFVVAPKFDRRTKEGKANSEAFDEANKGKEVLTPEQWDVLVSCVKSFTDHKPAIKLFSERIEVEKKISYTFIDSPITGYIDAIGFDFIFDIKMVQSAHPLTFQREAYNRMLHLQAAIYIMSNLDKGFYFIACEKSAPFNVSVMKADSGFIERGISELHRLTTAFNRCMLEDRFNEGYEFWNDSDICTLSLPKWA
jgi:hypothetical protein